MRDYSGDYSYFTEMDVDILRDPTICSKIRKDDYYAQLLYAALCNTEWCRNTVESMLKGEPEYSFSWRTAADLVAYIREGMSYMEFYASGNEGEVIDEIRRDLLNIGWAQVGSRITIDPII